MAGTPRFVELTTIIDSISIASGGSVAWVDVQYAAVEDASNFATAAFAGSDFSDYINAEQFGPVPVFHPAAVITGIECQVNCHDDTKSCRITEVNLTDNSGTTFIAGPLDCSKPMDASFGYMVIGGIGQLWGLTQAQIISWLNNKFSGFEFLVTEESGSASNVEIDGMKIIIYWDEPARIRNLLGCGI